MTQTIKITNDETQQTFMRTWDARNEQLLGSDHDIGADVWLDVELALCDKRKRGHSEGWSWEITHTVQSDDTRDYRWIGLGII